MVLIFCLGADFCTTYLDFVKRLARLINIEFRLRIERHIVQCIHHLLRYFVNTSIENAFFVLFVSSACVVNAKWQKKTPKNACIMRLCSWFIWDMHSKDCMITVILNYLPVKCVRNRSLTWPVKNTLTVFKVSATGNAFLNVSNKCAGYNWIWNFCQKYRPVEFHETRKRHGVIILILPLFVWKNYVPGIIPGKVSVSFFIHHLQSQGIEKLTKEMRAQSQINLHWLTVAYKWSKQVFFKGHELAFKKSIFERCFILPFHHFSSVAFCLVIGVYGHLSSASVAGSW